MESSHDLQHLTERLLRNMPQSPPYEHGSPDVLLDESMRSLVAQTQLAPAPQYKMSVTNAMLEEQGTAS